MGAEVVATTPELWETFVDICMNLGIDMTNLPALTTPQAIIEYCQTLNIQLQPLYKQVTTLEQTGWTWVVNTPANPTETTDMVVRGVTDLVVTGGSASSLTRGKALFGTVSRRVAAGAIVAALGVSTFAAQIGEYIDNFVESLKDWTIDGNDAVPVMIDEDGNTYLDRRAIETFRRGLINDGVFGGGSLDLIDTVLENNAIYMWNYEPSATSGRRYSAIKCVSNNDQEFRMIPIVNWNAANNYYNGNSIIWSMGSSVQIYSSFSAGYGSFETEAAAINNLSSRSLNSSYYLNNQRVYYYKDSKGLTDELPTFNNTSNFNSEYYSDISPIVYIATSINHQVLYDTWLANTPYLSWTTGNNPYTITVSKNCYVWANVKNSFVVYWVSKEPFDITLTRNGSTLNLTRKQFTNPYDSETYYYYYYDGWSYNPSSYTYPFVVNNDLLPATAGLQLFAMNHMGISPAGFNPTNRDVGDITKSLDTIYPDWTNNAVKIPSPKDNDLTNTADWLPVSITSTEPFEQDHTATSDDQDGDTTEDVQEGILQKMMELIQSLTQTDTGNPDEVITPTIPVGDSGDTPPATPTVISGASNGLWTIYNPTLSEVQQFGGWLWSESLIDQIIRQFNNPIEAVIGFMSIYCTPITGDRKVIKAGYLSSPVSAKEVTNQYVTINCGQVEVPEYYHTAVDYTRSKVEIFLPFIGIVPLDCSVVTGSTLEVIYRIDVLTGTCLAQIKVIKQNSDAVMYTYPGNCAVQLPLTASTYTGMVGAIMGAISGGFALGMGDVGGGIKKLGDGLVSGMSNLSGTAKSGNLSSNAGALGIRIPYLIITHPTVYDAMIYNQFYGYPSNVYQRLSAMSGFVRVKDIHLDSISCTDQELEMIYAKLKEGVIIS